MKSNPRVTIYTDGACDPNPGPGGWAAILRFGQRGKELTGADPDTTNNRMELRAAIEALRALTTACQVELHTDSEYLQLGITEWMPNWQSGKRKKKPANWELWEELLEAAAPHEIEWRWVRGHAGDPLNERVDRLATNMIPRASLSEAGPGMTVIYPGASFVNGKGGWAVVLRAEGSRQEFSGAQAKTTANRLLLTAATEGLRRAPVNRPARVVTAAEYLFRGATEWLGGWQRNGWRTREGLPVKNQEEWRALAEALSQRNVEWRIVKGEPPEGLARAGELAATVVKSQGR